MLGYLTRGVNQADSQQHSSRAGSAFARFPTPAPPVSAPAGFPRSVSHNDQAGETRGLEGGTKTGKG